MKPKTEELLYFLLWSCDTLMRPTFRNLTESFEGWAYRNGLRRQLAELERRQLLESLPSASTPSPSIERVVRLTEAGRLHALGGRDPESQWQRHWDGFWCLVMFDVPLGQDSLRNRLRQDLKRRGFGFLQQSGWVSPGPITVLKDVLEGIRVDVESLIVLEARPGAGETDEDIVGGAWDFTKINLHYDKHMEILKARPNGRFNDPSEAESVRQWAAEERAAWLKAVALDPLLPEILLPEDYLGRTAWRTRVEVLGQAAKQIHCFRP